MNIFRSIKFGVLGCFFAMFANATEPSHQNAARILFELLPSAEAIQKIYGQQKVVIRPENDVFFAHYRKTYIKILSTSYTELELSDLAKTLQSGGKLDAKTIQSLLQPANESIYRAMMFLSESEQSDRDGEVVRDLEGGP